MERKTSFGIYYKNEPLGIEEGVYPLNAHFVPEGHEKQIADDVYIIGRTDPPTNETDGTVIISENKYVLFVGTEALNRRVK